MNCPDWVRKDMKKSGQSKVQTGVKDMGSLFHGEKVMGYADGGEIDRWDKAWNSMTEQAGSKPTRAELEREAKYQKDLDRRAAQDHEKSKGIDPRSSTTPRAGGAGGMRPDTDITATRSRLKLADGGEALKQEGLKASNAEYDAKSGKDKAVSSFKRLFEGSIDDPNSTAYKKYGAGRGQKERDFDAADKQLDQLDALRKQESAKPVVNTVAPRTPKQDMVNDQDTSSRPSETKPQKFGAAFAEARKAGKQTFEWNGKRYTTEVAKAKKATTEDRDMDSSRQTSKGGKAAPPRPRLNFSTPGDRTRWDAKYKATHNADGTPK